MWVASTNEYQPRPAPRQENKDAQFSAGETGSPNGIRKRLDCSHALYRTFITSVNPPAALTVTIGALIFFPGVLRSGWGFGILILLLCPLSMVVMMVAMRKN